MSHKYHTFEPYTIQLCVMKDDKRSEILDFVFENTMCSSKEIHDGIKSEISLATVKRVLVKLKSEDLINTEGKGRGTKYLVSLAYKLLYPIDVAAYFENEIDVRSIEDRFNTTLIRNVLSKINLFTHAEIEHLNDLQNKYKQNISKLTGPEYKLELERLAIDLSWKSSQIEGNTYSLLETERLLKEKEAVDGKTKDDAIMLLNHKNALDFIIENPTYINPLTISSIEDIHSLLIRDLGIDRNIRVRSVGISGTNYRPLDNEHQIREALEDLCELVNGSENIFEKALWTLLLLSYIQPFGDGNKRTGRIVSNAILISNQYCPLSFRTIDSIEYKKAILLFYEQHSIAAFKKIFISQFEFAVNTYFI